jgi:endonuclease YncB( thermonuclease family)
MIPHFGFDNDSGASFALTSSRRRAIMRQIKRQSRGKNPEPKERVIFAEYGNFNDGDSGVVTAIDPKTASQSTKMKLRTAGIDSPETAQLFGPEAGEISDDLLRHADMLMVYIVGQGKYKRYLSWIYLLREGKTPICFNEEMIFQGGAWHLDFYHPDAEKLWNLEREAQANRRGLWKDLDGPRAAEVMHACHFRDQKSGKPYRPLRYREGVPFFDTLNRQTQRVGLFGKQDITLERSSV